MHLTFASNHRNMVGCISISSDTKKADFNGVKGLTSVDMMYKEMAVDWFHTAHLSMISLSFGNEAFSMIFILPDDESTDIGEAATILHEEWYSKRLTPGFKSKVYLPKFEIEYNNVLNETLAKMGIITLLGEEDFTNMSEDEIDFNLIKQFNKIRVDENGAEVASVVQSMLIGSASEGMTSPEIRFDRPFLFLVCEKSTDAILFMGKIEDL